MIKETKYEYFPFMVLVEDWTSSGPESCWHYLTYNLKIKILYNKLDDNKGYYVDYSSSSSKEVDIYFNDELIALDIWKRFGKGRF